MILSGESIRRYVLDGSIVVTPFEPSMLAPASLDLRLGSIGAVYTTASCAGREVGRKTVAPTVPPPLMLRQDRENPVRYFEMDPSGCVLHPGQFYLMHTLERIQTERFVPVLDGKSSIGRLGIQVHFTAGYGDPGFDGQFTLEVSVAHPVLVIPGAPFCQIRFNLLSGDVVPYAGNYRAQQAEGPVPSQSWRQIDAMIDRGLLMRSEPPAYEPPETAEEYLNNARYAHVRLGRRS